MNLPFAAAHAGVQSNKYFISRASGDDELIGTVGFMSILL